MSALLVLIECNQSTINHHSWSVVVFREVSGFTSECFSVFLKFLVLVDVGKRGEEESMSFTSGENAHTFSWGFLHVKTKPPINFLNFINILSNEWILLDYYSYNTISQRYLP